MAIKTKLTVQDEAFASTGEMWLVDNLVDAAALTEAHTGAVLVDLRDPNGNTSPIHDWTANKDVDPDTLTYLKGLGGFGAKLVVAFTPLTMSRTKTLSFIDALKASAKPLGLHFEVVEIPDGYTLADIAQDREFGGSPAASTEYLRDRIKKCIEKDVASSPAGMTAKDSDADIIFDIAVEMFDFHVSKVDGAFLTLKKGPKYAYIVTGGEPDLRGFLIAQYLERFKKVALKAAVSDAITAIEAYASHTCDPVDLFFRNGRSKATGTVWYDLGRKDGKVVGINADGWWISDEPDFDVFFKRSSTIGSLPDPVMVAEQDVRSTFLHLYRPHFNIKDAEFPMVLAWMATHIVPEWTPPVAMFLGESGCGKTSATTAVSLVVDGGDAMKEPGSIMPEKADDIAVTISKKSVSLWNNVSFISKAQSDDICQYIDGATYEKRKLHSNNEVVELTLNPSILLNGIAFGAINSDLKTRSIVFNLEVIKKPVGAIKHSLRDIKSMVVSAQPVLLGATFTLVSQIIREYPGLAVPSDGPRMPDYAKAVMAIDKIWDLDGATYRQYIMSLTDMSSEALDDPLFTIVHSLVVRRNNLKEDGTYRLMITNKDLMEAFANPYYSDGSGSGMPKRLYGTESIEFKNGNEMASRLKRAITDWKHFGVSIENHRDLMIDGVRGTYKEFIFDPSTNKQMWATHEQLVASDRF